ncbi:YheC/YheD family protein [Bacillaceae bacterium Marseille-Q3522]|nr:YheC/YheD family protein [Bacillaceae bacterium Marseille-Q3522]
MIKNQSPLDAPNDELDEFAGALKIDQFASQSRKISKSGAEGYKHTVWVKIKAYENDNMEIQAPKGIMNNTLILPTEIQFGVKKEHCKVHINEKSISTIRYNSYHYPIEIQVSGYLIEKMHIPIDFVYQLEIVENKVILGPTIGLLLGEKNQLYNPNYMEKYSDRLGEYEKFGGLVIAFSSRSVDWNEKIVYGMVYDPVQKHWRYDSAPIPAALYRRNFHQHQERIKHLMDLTNKQLFNSYHFKKSDLYLLQNEPEIQEHLPITHLLQKVDELIQFTHLHHKIILKPVSLSRGRGIFILEKYLHQGEGYILHDYRKKIRVRHLIHDYKALIGMLKSLEILDQDYLFQKYIPLLKVKNRSFDVRVVMQKANISKWICTGIECRVAGENEDLTNIARGGGAMTLEEVILQANLTLSYSKIHNNILKLFHSFFDFMERKEGHFAEFGIDIALDEEGYPWILEANIFPSFKGFKKMDYDTYLKIRYQPLVYAVHLQGFIVSQEEESTDEVYHQNKSYL